MISYRDLAKAGLHFGHQKTRWCPKMAPYIWGYKNNVHLIDVSKTAHQLEKAARFLESVATNGKTILWVGTKKPAQKIILQTAKKLKAPFVNHRWIGGTLSNFDQVKKSVTKLLHHEDIIAKAEKGTYYTKKELGVFQKLVETLEKNVGGIRTLTYPVGAIVLIDVNKERSALKEAARMGIPVVALVDTNSDPSLVDYVIPGNDDSPKAIQLIVDYLQQAVEKGQKAAGDKKVAELEVKAEKVAEKTAVKKAPAAKTEKKTAEKKTTADKAVKTEAKKEAATEKAAPKKKATAAKDEKKTTTKTKK